jgi:O-antigen/teichoic acid export membrane protein
MFQQVAETYFTQILRVGLGLAMTILVARILGPQGRGLYAVALAIGALGVQLGNFGLGSSNVYYVAKSRHLLSVLTGNALLVSFLVGGVGVLALGIVFSLWTRLAPVHGAVLTLTLLVIPFSLAYYLLQSLLLGVLDVRGYNKIEIANKVLAVALVVLFWALKLITVEAMLFGFVLAQIITFVWIVRRVESLAAPAKLALSIQLLREHVGLAFRAYLVLLFSFLVVRVDLLMVQYILGAERAGQYSIAASMADYVIMLPAVTANILFPKLSAMRDVGDKLRLMKKAGFTIGVLMLPVVVLSAALARPLVRLLFGQAYLPGAQAFIWLMPGIFFVAVETVVVQFLNSMGYPRSVVITWLLCVLVNIGLNLWVIPAYGIIGASINSSVTYILASVLIFWIAFKTGRRAPAMDRAVATTG